MLMIRIKVFSVLFWVSLFSVVQQVRSENRVDRVGQYYPFRVGLQFGVPFSSGDFTSFSAGKTYVGYMMGINGEYRFLPYLGIGVGISFGEARLGSRRYAKDFRLGTDGRTYYRQQSFTTLRYEDAEVVQRYWQTELEADFAVSRLWRAMQGSRWEIALIPVVGAARFRPKVNERSGGRFSDEGSHWSFIAGGSVGVSYCLADHWQLGLRSGVNWVAEDRFDGVASGVNKKSDLMWTTSLKVSWHFGKRRIVRKVSRTVVSEPVLPYSGGKSELPVVEPKGEISDTIMPVIVPTGKDTRPTPEVMPPVKAVADTLAEFRFLGRYEVFMLDAWNNRKMTEQVSERLQSLGEGVHLRIEGVTSSSSRRLVRRRSLQVKSWLIGHCGLKEDDFITINRTGGTAETVSVIVCE